MGDNLEDLIISGHLEDADLARKLMSNVDQQNDEEVREALTFNKFCFDYLMNDVRDKYKPLQDMLWKL